MATTNNVVIPNLTITDGTSDPPDCFNTIWSLTRGMKKAGWKYVASSNGSSKDTSFDPNADLWGALPVGTITNVGAAAASITAVANGRATVTGLTGIVATDKGRFLQIGGSGSGNNGYHQIEEVLSATSVRIDARRVTITAPDVNNTSLTWDIRDPVLNTFPAINGAACWWVARGPSIIKIPLTAAPTGTFVRGENISEATSNFEGELLGIVYDATSTTGYMVVAPRVIGSGAETTFNLTTGQVVTGSISGATATHSGTALEYQHEVVFWKTTNGISGSIFYGTFEPVAESTDMFSSAGLLTASTATVPPGGGGVFPAHAWVAKGTTATGGHVAWTGYDSTNSFGRAQVMCADAIWEEDYSADGSYLWMDFCYGNPPNGGYVATGFQRLDNIEDGDLDPYVSYSWHTATLYTNNRTNAGTNRSTSANDDADDFSLTADQVASSSVGIRGWRRRGLSNELFQEFEPAALYSIRSGTLLTATNGDYDADTVATEIVYARAREPVWAVSAQIGRRMRKGTLRWMTTVGLGSIGATYDNKYLIQMSHTSGAMVIGPWDGTTDLLMT